MPTRYVAISRATDYEIAVFMIIPLCWRVLLEVPIVRLDLRNPKQLIDFIRDIVADTTVVNQGERWSELAELGSDGAGGLGSHATVAQAAEARVRLPGEVAADEQ